MSNENFVKIEGLYEAAYRAHTGTSFSPDRRAADCVKGHEEELNADLEAMPEAERPRYIDGYKKHLFSWLSAKSKIYSTMIAGAARFPVARMEKLNRYEHNRSVEFSDWRKRALATIARRVQEAKPEAQKRDERWLQVKENMERSLATITAIDSGMSPYSRPLFVSSVSNSIKTFAKNGDVELVNKCLALIEHWNDHSEKPVISAKNAIWLLPEEAEKNREAAVDKASAESQERVVNGVRVVSNSQEDRLQLFFDGKPPQEMISLLKGSAFKWSPSRGCWQRQLTNNAIYAANKILA